MNLPLDASSLGPSNPLSNYVRGSSMIVTYYRQILGADDAVKSQDLSLDRAYQRYMKILNLELMVTTPFSPTQDEASKEFRLTGEATAYNFLIPNTGDMFIADTGDGRKMIFTLTGSTKSTHRSTSNYVIDYQSVSYVTTERLADLEEKSREVYQFSKDLLLAGQAPLVSQDVYALMDGLRMAYGDLVTMYFHDFFSTARQTLLVPDQPMETYDHFLTKAVVELVASDESLTVPHVRLPSVSADPLYNYPTVWDALIRANATLLATGIERAGVIPTFYFRSYPYLAGIYYTGLDSVVYPKDERTDVDGTYQYVNHPVISNLRGGKLRYKSFERAFREKDDVFFHTACQCVEGQGDALSATLPDIVPVTQDDYYVFTKGFYGVRDSTLASALEFMARQAIRRQPVDPARLLSLAQGAKSWPNLERYYYFPVLFALIRIALS